MNFSCLLNAMQDSYFPLLVLCSLFILTFKWTSSLYTRKLY